MLKTLGYDLRHALRPLRRDWGFTVVALLSLALGIGANAAVFSLVDQVLLRLLPVKAPAELVQLRWEGPFLGSGRGNDNLISHPFFRQLARENRVFGGMFARAPFWVHVSTGGGSELAVVELASGSYFDVLGVKPALGRVLAESDDQQRGGHPVVVVSHDYWRNHLGGRSDVLGTTIQINRHPLVVIGVAAAGFRGLERGEAADMWVPLMMSEAVVPVPSSAQFDWLDNWRGQWLHVFGRLAPGVSAEKARAALAPWFKAMLEEDTRRPSFPHVTPTERARFLASTLELLPAARGTTQLREMLERPLSLLMAATVLVLLLACLNVANLCLARAFARRRELALRAALGGTRAQLARQLLLQAALLAVAGGLVGLLLAPSAIAALLAFFPESVALSPAIDLRMFGFGAALMAATVLLFGLFPALAASRAQPAHALKEQSGSVAGGLRLRKGLVVGQIALALVLLIGAGLFLRTLAGLRARGPGFATANLLHFTLDPSHDGYDPPRARQLLGQALQAIRALSEVEAAGLASSRLLNRGSWNGRVTLDDGRRTVSRTAHFNGISPGFFAALGVPVVLGRDFQARDEVQGEGGEYRAAIINQQMARRYFGDRSPLGVHLGMGGTVDTRTDIEIVGVVQTFSYRGVRATEDQVFFPAMQGHLLSGTFYVRTRAASGTAVASIRAALDRLDPRLAMNKVRTLDAQLDEVLIVERLLATLAGAFAALATLLVVIGLYGLMSFVVSRRTREIGIRLALGASPGAAVGLVVRETALLVAAGLTLALVASWGLGRVVQSQLYGVQPMDPATIVAAAVLVAGVALLAAALPARRASAVSPTEALRAE